MSELKDLVRNRDPGDLSGDERDRLAEEQAPERRRRPERRQVDRDATEQAAGPRWRGANRLLLEGWLWAAQGGLEERLGFAGLRGRLEQLPGPAAEVVDIDAALLCLLGDAFREVEGLVEQRRTTG